MLGGGGVGAGVKGRRGIGRVFPSEEAAQPFKCDSRMRWIETTKAHGQKNADLEMSFQRGRDGGADRKTEQGMQHSITPSVRFFICSDFYLSKHQRTHDSRAKKCLIDTPKGESKTIIL